MKPRWPQGQRGGQAAVEAAKKKGGGAALVGNPTDLVVGERSPAPGEGAEVNVRTRSHHVNVLRKGAHRRAEGRAREKEGQWCGVALAPLGPPLRCVRVERQRRGRRSATLK